MSEKPHKPPAFENWGMWDVENISVEYISYSWAQFTCKHIFINGGTEIKNVFFGPLDRLIGRSFEDKVKNELNEFRNKMQARNDKILKLRQMSRRLTEESNQ